MRRASPRFARGTRRPPRKRDPATAGPCTAQASQKRQRCRPSSLPPINGQALTWPEFRARHEKENAGITEAQQGRPSEQRRERRLTRVCIWVHSTAGRPENLALGPRANSSGVITNTGTHEGPHSRTLALISVVGSFSP